MSEEAWRDYSSISGHPPGLGSVLQTERLYIGCNFDKLIFLTSQSSLPIQSRTIILLEPPGVLLTRLRSNNETVWPHYIKCQYM